jgi:hypothetical protein
MANWQQFLPVFSEIVGICTLFGVMALMSSKPLKPLEPPAAPPQPAPTLTDNELMKRLITAASGPGGRQVYTVWKWDRHTSGVGARLIGVQWDKDRILLVVERVIPEV